MSFVTELNKKCQEYTNMVINGTRIQVPYKDKKICRQIYEEFLLILEKAGQSFNNGQIIIKMIQE